MEQEYFGVSLEKLLTSGGQTLYMVAWSLIIGTIASSKSSVYGPWDFP